MKMLIHVLVVLALACVIPSPAHSKHAKRDDITLYGEVNYDSAVELVQKIQSLQDGPTTKPIYLFINSGGGSVAAGGMIINAMEASVRPVYTVDVGLSASMAAWIFSYGKRRLMYPNSALMYHNASGGFQGDVTRIYSRLRVLNQQTEQYNSNLAKRSGMDLQEIREREGFEFWMTTDEALKFRMCDGIVNFIDYPAK